ncbi:hypothetical protein C8J57DRAFT_1511703 [Mycena rebaudengoi]|nr:hypothetical protein C8J57DRAFT_1511703 [Mycena rebaudengoi]
MRGCSPLSCAVPPPSSLDPPLLPPCVPSALAPAALLLLVCAARPTPSSISISPPAVVLPKFGGTLWLSTPSEQPHRQLLRSDSAGGRRTNELLRPRIEYAAKGTFGVLLSALYTAVHDPYFAPLFPLQGLKTPVDLLAVTSSIRLARIYAALALLTHPPAPSQVSRFSLRPSAHITTVARHTLTHEYRWKFKGFPASAVLNLYASPPQAYIHSTNIGLKSGSILLFAPVSLRSESS